MITYKIGVIRKEYTQEEIIMFAIEKGWPGIDKRAKVTDISGVAKLAVDYLEHRKGYIINTVYSNVGDLDITRKDYNREFPLVPRPEKVVILETAESKEYKKPLDSKVMIIYMFEDIYRLDTALLGEECWDVQAFGASGCTGCPDNASERCHGGVSKVSDKNSIGNVIPVAVKLCKRHRREKGREIDW